MYRPDSYTISTNATLNQDSPLIVLFAGESQTKPSHQLGPKIYDYYLIHIILSGKGRFHYQGTEIEIHVGDSFLIEPEQLVSYTSDEEDPWHYQWIAFRGEEADSLVAHLQNSPHYPIIQARNWRSIAKWYTRIQYSLKSKSPSLHLESIGYLHLLFAAYQRTMHPATQQQAINISKQQHIVQQVLHYLSTQYAEPITIENMAQHLGYNRAYLSRLFKKSTRVSPATFLLKYRVDKARLLMRERQELTIEQIAASTGFHDALYFSKQFRRFYRMSPTSYRDQLQKSH